MSNYDFIEPRARHRTLLIVEGQHEKYELLDLLLKCFPEIYIKRENIEIFETNIYVLFDKLVKMYGEDWDNQEVDVVMLIRDMKGYPESFKKSNFSDVFMIFDYERHDPRFSEDKICRMQDYFHDSIEVGKLYINYPMVESYMHFPEWPDNSFENAQTSATMRRGNYYKNSLNHYFVTQLVDLPSKFDGILLDRFDVNDVCQRKGCIEQLLMLHDCENLEQQVEEILKHSISDEKLQTAKFQIMDVIDKRNYCKAKCTYYEYMRKVFMSIIQHNIFKAHKIQGLSYEILENKLRDAYFELEYDKILDKQNYMSREKDIIMILNTSVFLVPDYNFSLITG